MKKFIFFAIAVVLIGSIIPLGTAFAGSASISISGPKSVEAGKTYTYTITLSGTDVSSAMVTSISTSGVFSGSGSRCEIGSGGENTSGSKSVDVSVTVSSSANPGDTGTISASGQFGYWNEDMTDVLTGSMSKSLSATVAEPTPDPTPTPTTAPTTAPTTQPTAAPTATTAPTATVKPTTTPKPTATSATKPTNTPKPTATPSATATATTEPSASPSASATIEPTPTPEKPLEWPDVEEMVDGLEDGGTLSVNMEGKTEIPASVLSQLKDKGGILEIDFGDYSCTIDGRMLNELPEDLSTLDLSVRMVKDESLSQKADGFDVYQLNFSHHGELPGVLTYTFFASENAPGDTLYLYYSYEQAGIIEGMQAAVVDSDGYVTFEIYHCSSYFVSDTIIDGAMNNFAAESVPVIIEEEPMSSGISLWILIICIIGTAVVSIFLTMYIGKTGFFKVKNS